MSIYNEKLVLVLSIMISRKISSIFLELKPVMNIFISGPVNVIVRIM